MGAVKGYLGPVDALTISSILIDQQRQGYGGGIAEIGVFYGRSFFLMAKLLGPGERALAMDLFDIGMGATGEKSSQLREFLSKAASLGTRIDEDDVIAGPSSTLRPQQICDRIGQVRFFSIDGGHGLEHVTGDAALATKTISPYGVICFDDFCNPQWPEVTFGVFKFLQEKRDFAPFALTDKKLYVCRQGFVKFYLDAIAGAGWLARIPKWPLTMIGHEVVFVGHPLKKRIPYEVLSRCGLGWLSQYLYL